MSPQPPNHKVITVTKWLKKGVNFPFYQKQNNQTWACTVCACTCKPVESLLCRHTNRMGFLERGGGRRRAAVIVALPPSLCLRLCSLAVTLSHVPVAHHHHHHRGLIPSFSIIFFLFAAPPPPSPTPVPVIFLFLSSHSVALSFWLSMSSLLSSPSSPQPPPARPPCTSSICFSLVPSLCSTPPPPSLSTPLCLFSSFFFPPLSAPSVFLRVNSSDAFVEGFHSDGPF